MTTEVRTCSLAPRPPPPAPSPPPAPEAQRPPSSDGCRAEFNTAWPVSRPQPFRDTRARASSSVDWDAWGSVRAAATPTAPAAPQQRTRQAASGSSPVGEERPPAAAVGSKPQRGWASTPVRIASPQRDHARDDANAPPPQRPAERGAHERKRGPRPRGEAGQHHAKRDDGFGLMPQQLAAIRRTFGQFAEGGLVPGRPVTYVSVDPRRLGDACRSIKLAHPLIDADVRAIVGSRHQKRAHEAIDLLEFTKLVSARLVKIGAGRPKESAAPAPAPTRVAVPVTVAPWLKKKGTAVVQEDEPAASDSPADEANFPMLGVQPMPRSQPLPHPHPESEVQIHPSAQQSRAVQQQQQQQQQKKQEIAPPAGTLAQRQVEAALARQGAQAAARTRGWEKVAEPAPPAAIGGASATSQAAYATKSDEADGRRGKGKSKSKAAERAARMNEPKTLDTFWGNVMVSKSSQSKQKKKKDAAPKDAHLSKKGKVMVSSRPPLFAVRTRQQFQF